MKAFSKYARLITAAAKCGDSSLDDLTASARAVNMPKAAIEKAIARGRDPTVGAIEELIYEGAGPEGSAFVIQCFSDNKNRTRDLVRAVFNKAEANFGTSVTFMFQSRGEVVVAAMPEEDESLLTACLDAGAEEIEWDEEIDVRTGESVSAATIVCDAVDVGAVEAALKPGWHVLSVAVTRPAVTSVELSKDAVATVTQILDGLDAVEGVDSVFHNCILPSADDDGDADAAEDDRA
jgi:transcriptional/translational regulatory protein YebC/TACO1